MNSETQPLLSRAADSVYWMARYIERTENIARFIGVNLHLQLDLPTEPAHQWQPIIDTAGDTEDFRQRYGEATQTSVIQFLALDTANANSIYSCLWAARENARAVRETISSEMWEQINRMYLEIQSPRSRFDPEWVTETLRTIRLSCHMFQGITDATMSHNEAWHFLRLGRELERADKTSRILDVKYFYLLPSMSVGTPYDDIHWSAVLKSVSAFEMYRQKHGRILPLHIVEFLVFDREFPRSIHYCVRSAEESLHAITGTPLGSDRYLSKRLMGPLSAELGFTPVDKVIQYGVHEYLDGLQLKMNAIDDGLLNDFFTWRTLAQPVPV
jgi:uncharacterized alpha-E superfamily protein